MVRRTDKKPKGVFQNLSEKQWWFELYNNDGVYAYVAIDLVQDWASFHSHVKRWNHNIAKSIKRDWIVLRDMCRAMNVKMIVVSNGDMEDKRWPKFIKLFGFPYPQKILVSKQEI